jgi:hypothetical protein
MKLYSLILALIFGPCRLFGQDSSWKTTPFNAILTLDLPITSQYVKSSFIEGYAGELNKKFYGFNHYDTVFLPIETEKQFEVSLVGFVSGRISDSALKSYDVIVVDTSIGRSTGLFATLTTKETSAYYKQIYFYVTLANNQYYWFYTYSPFLHQADNETDFFFKSIVFSWEKLKERSFKLPPIYLTKNAN